MPYDPNGYDPYAYMGGTTPSPTSNGVGGALSNESVTNATVQQKATGGNPYADAITHTQQWMQYVMPMVGAQQNSAQTPTQVGSVPLSVTQNQPVQGQLPAGSPTQVGPVAAPQSSQMRSTTQANTLAGNDPFVSMWGGGLSDSQRNPLQSGSEIGNNVPPRPTEDPGDGNVWKLVNGEWVAVPIGGGAGGGGTTPDPTRNPRRPITPGGISDDERINSLVNDYGYTPEYAQGLLTRAREWAQTPGFEWLASHPQIIAMYEAEQWDQNANGGAGGPRQGVEQQDFVEWVTRNRDALMQYGIQDIGTVTNLGYERWANRLANSGGPNGDTWVGWVTPDHVRAYDEWWRAENAAGRPGLTFWEWAGSVNAPPEEGPTTRPPNPGYPPGGGGGGNTPPPTPPEGGDDYLRRLIDSMRAEGRVGREDMLRQLRHEAGLTGLSDMGGYGNFLSDAIRQSLMNENSAIYEVMNASSEAERNRALQKYLGELGARTQESVASIGAGASMYGDDLRYRLGLSQQDLDRYLGMAGLDVTREGNYLNYNTDQMRAIIDWLQTMMQSQNPGNIFNGLPPTGDIYVH